jgi:hypothetical protein
MTYFKCHCGQIHDNTVQGYCAKTVYGDGYRREGAHVIVGTARPLAENFVPSGRSIEAALYDEPTAVSRLYHYQLFWSNEDNSFVATCNEFPSLSCLYTDPSKAISEIMWLVEEAVAMMIGEGETPPRPQKVEYAKAT